MSAQAAGTIRPGVSAFDVMLAIKGVCEVQRLFPGLPRGIGRRQPELVKAGNPAAVRRPKADGPRRSSVAVQWQ